MALVQKDKSLQKVDVTVQTAMTPNQFTLVPVDPGTLEVNLNFLLFVTPQRPDILINKLDANVLYRIEDDPNGNLIVEQVPIAE